MKLFLAIALSIGGGVLLLTAFLDMTNGHTAEGVINQLFFGVVLLAGGLAWLWKQWPEVKARLDHPPSQ